MYKVIIIDDESKPREVLSIKIREECPMLEIVAAAASAQEGYELCRMHHPDIVFLDVSMPNESGFDFIKKFDAIPFEVIFATAYQEFAIEAFKVSAVGYLLKPVKSEELVKAVNTAIDHLNFKYSAQKYAALTHNIKPNNQTKKRIVIPCSDRYEFVDIEQIVICESSDKYTYIHINDGRKILSSQYLGFYKNILEEFGFFVPHKSFVINMNYVVSLTLEDEILFKNSTLKVPLARRRKADFLHEISINKSH
ncbi:MAG: response regulator transcription factor [Saprospiraceae bacterium]|nr:response regulator transcription factor [Saprospiraceae bacterium]